MQYNEFMQHVQEYASLGSQAEAERVAVAVLETLGERLTKTEREHLAAQLPNELKHHLTRSPIADRYSLEVFYDKVGARSKTKYVHAKLLSLAVARVLREAVAPGELRDILTDLPAEYGELFGRQPASPLSPTALTSEEERHLHRESRGN